MVFATGVFAQRVALKTNLLYDATSTPNIGAEFGLGRKTTAQIYYGWNPWKFGKYSASNTSSNAATAPGATDARYTSRKQLRHWMLMPEVRYWFCERFNGHFIGLHAMGGQFNMGGIKTVFPGAFFDGDRPDTKSNRYEGWYVGGGFTYGYQWMLSKHWNLEASLGVGYNRLHYKEFTDCNTCDGRYTERNQNYIGLTKAVLAIMYCF